MINPYYLVFYKFYKWLNKLNPQVQKGDMLFAVYSILFLLFIPHMFITMFVMKNHNILTSNLNISKYLFGILFSLSFWLINYLLFSVNDRYKKIVLRIEQKSRIEFVITYIILTVYFSIPVIISVF